MMQLIVTPHGECRCLYDESIPLHALGRLAIARGSHVEPDAEGNWWADLAPVNGPNLGPFVNRSDALAAEAAWLTANWLHSASPELLTATHSALADGVGPDKQ
jgi:hypothetical protein